MPRPTRRLRAGLALALALAPAVGACGATGPTAGPPTAGPTIDQGPTPTLAPPVSFGPPPTPTPDDGSGPLVIDAALLELLPAEVAGAPVIESLDEATLALGNAVLQEIASAVDAAVAVDTSSGNIVYALIVRLRPARLGEAAFRDWRDSYDEGACAVAGPVIGWAEQVIDGRTVHIGTCEGGIRTYHVRLDGPEILVSAWSLGDAGFGELLLSTLRVEG